MAALSADSLILARLEAEASLATVLLHRLVLDQPSTLVVSREARECCHALIRLLPIAARQLLEALGEAVPPTGRAATEQAPSQATAALAAVGPAAGADALTESHLADVHRAVGLLLEVKEATGEPQGGGGTLDQSWRDLASWYAGVSS